MYMFNFAYVGSRATGNGAGGYLLARPNWKGKKPKGILCSRRSENKLWKQQWVSSKRLHNTLKLLNKYLGMADTPSASSRRETLASNILRFIAPSRYRHPLIESGDIRLGDRWLGSSSLLIRRE